MKKTRFNSYSIIDQMTRYNLTKKEAEEKVRQRKIKNGNIYDVKWQMIRHNITKQEAEEKILEIRKKNSTAGNQNNVKWQMIKFNLTEQEAKEKIKNNNKKRRDSWVELKEKDPKRWEAIRPTNKEHWIKKGFSSKDAIIKAKEYMDNMRSVFQENIKENPKMYESRTSTQLKYWLCKKGLTLEDAKIALKERQSTFTLEKCIAKLGKESGTQRWKDRQTKWSAKVEKMYQNGEFTKFPKNNWSNTEIKFIKDLTKDFKPEEKFYSALNGKQFFRHFKETGTTNSYDFVMGNKIIEFNGDYWHMNPKNYKPEYFHVFQKITAKEKWKADKFKNDLIQKEGYEVLTIWESDYKKDPKTIIEKCIQYLYE